MVMLTLPRVQVCLAGFLRVCPLECICKFTFVCTYVGLYICRLVGGWVGRPVGVSSVIGCLFVALVTNYEGSVCECVYATCTSALHKQHGTHHIPRA